MKDERNNKKKKKNSEYNNLHDFITVLMVFAVLMLTVFACSWIDANFADIIMSKTGEAATRADKQNAENISRILICIMAVLSMIVVVIFIRENSKQKKLAKKNRALREREAMRKEIEAARDRVERAKKQSNGRYGEDTYQRYDEYDIQDYERYEDLIKRFKDLEDENITRDILSDDEFETGRILYEETGILAFFKRLIRKVKRIITRR